MKTIVLTGGGTAGHCIPHVAILDELKKRFDKVYYIGSKNGIEKSIIEKTGIPYYSIPSTKLVRGVDFKNLTIPFVLFSAVRQAKKLLQELSPDVVFSKGGYVSLPVVIAAHGLSIPVATHESDYSLGLANKIASKYSEFVFTAFKDTATKTPNGVYTGTPVRQELLTRNKKMLKTFDFKEKKPVLTVIGGSLGSQALNDAVRISIKTLTQTFNVVHVCGKGNKNFLSVKGYRQLEYCDDMSGLFGITDVCVSRAGGNATAELLALKIPTLLVPLPKGRSRGDQIQNAEYYEKHGYFNVLKQEDLSRKTFTDEILKTYKNRNKYIEKMKTANVSDANGKIVNILVNIANG